MKIQFPKKAFLELGLHMAGFAMQTIENSCKATNNERLKDFYYVSTKTMKMLFYDIQDPDLGEACIAKPNPAHLLQALYFLKKYPTKIALAAFAKCTKKMALSRAWKYVAVQALKDEKVRSIVLLLLLLRLFLT